MKMQTFRKFKRISAILAGTFLISVLSAFPVTYADGMVDVSIETKEININDIPSDRKVSLAVNLDNDPGVNGMALIISADSRLGIDDMFKWCVSPHKVSTAEFQSGPHIDMCDIIMNDQDNKSGMLLNLFYRIPDDCRPGDFYEVAFYGQEIMGEQICYADSLNEWHFGSSSFGSLSSGGIRITGEVPAPDPPVQNEPQVVLNESQELSAPASQESASSNSSRNETEALTSEAASTLSETSITASETTTAGTIKNSDLTDELLITEYSSDTETELSGEPDTEEKSEKNFLLYILIIAGAAAAAGVVIFIIKKEKTKS